MSERTKKIAGATTALVLLTALNFVNYIDRYILPGVQELVKAEFHLSDERLGALTFWFFVTYIIAAPLTGWLGDRMPRKPLIVIGALLWSAMNFFTATVHSYDALLVRHAALGIGEASFGIYALAVLSDFFPPDQRNRMMTVFNCAIPIGAAIGYSIAGWLGGAHGWRTPFFFSAVPGVIIAFLVLFFVKEPVRGASDELEMFAGEKGAGNTLRHLIDSSAKLVKNPAYVTAILGYAMVTFMVGGISVWMPSFLQRFHGDTPASAGFSVGAITAVTGFVGTMSGGIWAHRWMKRNHRALYYVAAISALLTLPAAIVCFFGPNWSTLPALAAAEVFIFMGSAPVNAAILNSVSARMRATGLAGELLIIHALGDVPSPRIIGAVSDALNLRYGLAFATIALLLAAAVLFLGSRFAPRVAGADAQ